MKRGSKERSSGKRTWKWLVWALAAGTLVPLAIYAAEVGDSGLWVFQPGDPIKASEFNDNFETLGEHVDRYESAIRVDSEGKIGIGTGSPQVTLDVNGGIRPGDSDVVSMCGPGPANGEGSQRYNYTTHQMEYCNGSGWVSAAGSAKSVSAKYGQSYAQTIVNGPTTNILNFDYEYYDSDDAVTPGNNWVFTAPVSGVYRITSTVVTAAYNWGNASNSMWIWAVHNGTWETFMGGMYVVTTISTQGTVHGSATINCAAGDTLAVGIVIWRSANTNMLGAASQSWVSIEKVADSP